MPSNYLPSEYDLTDLDETYRRIGWLYNNPAPEEPVPAPGTNDGFDAADAAIEKLAKALPAAEDAVDRQRKELLDILELDEDGTPAKSLRVTEADPSPFAKGKKETRHETVLKTDAWDRAKGEELSRRNGDGEDFDKAGPTAWADFHTAAFASEPEVHEDVLDERRKEFVRGLLETDEFKQVREKSVFSRFNSEIVAESVAETWAKLVEADEKTKREEASWQTPKGKDLTRQEYGRNLDRAVNQAVSKAQQEIDSLENVARGIGLGGGADNRMELGGLKSVYDAARKNPQLMRVFELAGRYRRVAQSKQRTKFVHGPDELVGVDLSNDLTRVLPVELARLADDDLELDAMRRLVEGTLQSKESRTVEHVGKGPVVVCVDESGSMQGERIANAKAFALAMAWVAKAQNRWIALVSFSGTKAGYVVAMPPGNWDEKALLDWLTHFYNGGTTADVPLGELPFTYWPQFMSRGMARGKTDIVYLTDGEISVPDTMLRRFLDWKAKEEVRAIGLVIGSRPGGLAAACDETHLVESLDATGDAVGSAFGI